MVLALGASLISVAAYVVGGTTLVNVGSTTATFERGRTNNVGCASAWNGTDTLVLWADYRLTNNAAISDIYGARVASSGLVRDRPNLQVQVAAGLQSWPSVTYGSGVWLAVWADTRAGNSDIYAARVDSAGTVLDDAGIAIASSALAEQFPSVGFDGTRFVIAYELVNSDGGIDVEAGALRPDGTFDFQTVTFSNGIGDQTKPSTACKTGQCMVAWDDNGTGPGDIYASRITANVPTDLGGFPVSTAAARQGNPSISSDGTNYLVAFEDARNGTPDVTAARVLATGAVLDPGGILLASSGTPKSEVAVGCTAAQCLVSWQESTSGINVMGSRVNPSTGAVLDTTPVAYTIGGRFKDQPCVSAMGSSYLVSFFDNTFSGADNNRGSIIDAATGKLVYTAINSIDNGDMYNSALFTPDKSTAYVAWSDNRDYGFRLTLRKLNANGTPLGPPMQLDTEELDFTPGITGVPSFATDGTGNMMAVWSRWSYYEYFINVQFRTFNAGGFFEDAGTQLSSGVKDARAPSIAWGGANYVVLWDDATTAKKSIRGARISATGVVADPLGMVLYSGLVDQTYPKLRCHGSQCLMVWADRRAGGAALLSAFIDPATLTMSPVQQLDLPVDFEWATISDTNDGFLVAWTHVNGADYDLRAARMLFDAGVLDTDGGLRIADRPERDYDPAVATDGLDFHVTWTHRPDAGPTEILGARLSWDGTIDPVLGEVLVPPGLGNQVESDVLFMGSGKYLMSFTDERDLVLGTEVVGTRSFTYTSDAGPVVDSGVPDAGSAFDAGSVFDAGAGVDAGGGADAAVDFDAGATDVDSGIDLDAGVGGDAGFVADASVTSDAGAVDAGLIGDSGVPEALDGGTMRPPVYVVGCSCDAGGGLGAVLGVLLALRRRRARSA